MRRPGLEASGPFDLRRRTLPTSRHPPTLPTSPERVSGGVPSSSGFAAWRRRPSTGAPPRGRCQQMLGRLEGGRGLPSRSAIAPLAGLPGAFLLGFWAASREDCCSDRHRIEVENRCQDAACFPERVSGAKSGRARRWLSPIAFRQSSPTRGVQRPPRRS